MTMEILLAMVESYNTKIEDNAQHLHIFNFQRSSAPYGLMNSESQTILRGTKNELFLYLQGAITGINTYKQLHNL